MRALQVRRSVGRLGLARVASALAPAAAVRVGPLEYTTVDPPELPGPGWRRVRTRLAGICGSDLSMIEGHASMYFDDWVSFPFVPGHEVVGELDDGTRVVLEPVLGHEARGFRAPFEGAAPGDGDDYAHLAAGPLEPGIQTGFCSSTGGGWSPQFVAHDTQLHRVGDDVPDERAVLIEPLAGGIHAAFKAGAVPAAEPVIAVLGAGTMGLAAIAGLVRYVPRATVVVGARYPHQQREARRLGAHEVVPAGELARAVRRMVGCHVVGDHLSSGAHATIDAVGSQGSVRDALAMTRPRGRVVMMGMPAEVTLDLTGLWHRETELVGAYTYGTESDGRRTFDLAIETAEVIEAERWLSATYPLADHVDAIAHAASAGRRGAIKIAFDLRSDLR
jgi:threonine dehydrogenase-like Zn-dependent dehydrogenase